MEDDQRDEFETVLEKVKQLNEALLNELEDYLHSEIDIR